MIIISSISAMGPVEVQQMTPSTQERECPICFVAPGADNSLVRTPCGHEICRDCLWKLQKQGHVACPLCRADISAFAREHGKRGYFSISQLRERGTVFPITDNKLNLRDQGINSLIGLQDIPGIQDVVEIDLSHNKLISLPVGIFRGLNKLEDLRLHDNPFRSLPAGVFDGLNNLKRLYLNHSGLTALSIATFYGLYKLEHLDLSNNSFTSLPADVFGDLDNLETLYLNGSGLTSLPLVYFLVLPI